MWKLYKPTFESILPGPSRILRYSTRIQLYFPGTASTVWPQVPSDLKQKESFLFSHINRHQHIQNTETQDNESLSLPRKKTKNKRGYPPRFADAATAILAILAILALFQLISKAITRFNVTFFLFWFEQPLTLWHFFIIDRKGKRWTVKIAS